MNFLPASLNMFNGNPNSKISDIGLFELIEIIINYILTAIVNIVDFILIFINWIPPVKKFVEFIYRSPDMLEKSTPFLFGGRKGHRNIITHSVFNPVFIMFVILFSKIGMSLSQTQFYMLRYLFILIGICFTCHLLCDTMPKHWRGFSNIKIYIFINFGTLNANLSKLWLYINSILSILILHRYLFF